MTGNLTEVPTTNLRYVAFQEYILPGRTVFISFACCALETALSEIEVAGENEPCDKI